MFSEMLEIVSHDTAILLLGLTESNETSLLKRHPDPVLTADLVTTARTGSTEVVTDGERRQTVSAGNDARSCGHTEGILPYEATWIELEGVRRVRSGTEQSLQ